MRYIKLPDNKVYDSVECCIIDLGQLETQKNYLTNQIEKETARLMNEIKRVEDKLLDINK